MGKIEPSQKKSNLAEMAGPPFRGNEGGDHVSKEGIHQPMPRVEQGVSACLWDTHLAPQDPPDVAAQEHQQQQVTAASTSNSLWGV